MTSAELIWRNAKTNFNGKVVKGMNEKFLEVGDVMQILGISRSAAYKLMRQINSELEKKGYIVIRGKVSRKYFEERIYGILNVLVYSQMMERRFIHDFIG